MLKIPATGQRLDGSSLSKKKTRGLDHARHAEHAPCCRAASRKAMTALLRNSCPRPSRRAVDSTEWCRCQASPFVCSTRAASGRNAPTQQPGWPRRFARHRACVRDPAGVAVDALNILISGPSNQDDKARNFFLRRCRRRRRGARPWAELGTCRVDQVSCGDSFGGIAKSHRFFGRKACGRGPTNRGSRKQVPSTRPLRARDDRAPPRAWYQEYHSASNLFSWFTILLSACGSSLEVLSFGRPSSEKRRVEDE